MTDLFLAADVELRLGRSFNDSEALRIDALVADVSASIRNYTKQTITEETTTARIRVRNGKLRLPQRPVTDVDSVLTINGDPTMYEWVYGDVISASPNVPDTFAWEPFTNGIQALDVTYTHGWDPVPDVIVGVCCSVALRALGRDPVDAGMTSESIAGYSYSLGAAGAAGPFGLLQAEKDILDSFCRVGGSINTSPGLIT